MNDWNPEANEIFAEVAAVSDRDARERLLNNKCGNNDTLRRAVESLLGAYNEEPEFLNEALVNRRVEPTVAGVGEAVGTMVGPYKLLQKVGEGGFGVVYMAEQKQPVRRKVALKVIKAGMDTREVIARFEAERQALAMMHHPNIAKVLDAGTTESGRPYFVMELVCGVAITDFCDKNRLGTRERLTMFANVCQAVQHAHHKGIIHRDLKPSNVMVTLNDGQPLVKVIDFGVAKAINQELTEKTLFTSYGQMVGTPQYMSPEQAEMSAMGIDTRSDVYSLGVLLYELLTGTTPLDLSNLRAAGLAEVQRLITSEEAPRPSARLSTLGDELSIVATNRMADPSGLQKLVRGELDWIVMTSLDKDRARRYETASAFAADVHRYLNDEAVEACPPSVQYRIRKFVRRNRISLATGALVLVSLISGLIGTSWMAIEAKQQQGRALLALDRVQDELRWKAFMLALSGQTAELEDVLKDVDVSKTPNEGWTQRVRGIAAKTAGDPAAAVTYLKEAIHLGDQSVAVYDTIVKAYYALNDNPSSRPYRRVRDDMLEALDVHTPEDEFFVAAMTCGKEPRRAFEIANRVFKKYPSPAVLQIRSYACESLGKQTGDVKWLDEAIADSHAEWRASARDGVPNFPMWCHATAIDIAKANGDQQTVEYHTLAGRRLAEQLRQMPNYGAHYTAASSAVFYEAIGDLTSAEEAHRAGAQKSDNGKRKYAGFLLAHYRDELALEVIDQMDVQDSYHMADLCRVAVFAKSPETMPKARELLLKRLATPDGLEIQWIGLLHQCGFPNDAVREAKRAVDELRAAEKQVPAALMFFSNELDANQLEQSADGNRLLLADAHFRIIQWHLGSGNIERAKDCLEKWPPILQEYTDDNLMLNRLPNLWEKDPNWPHWLEKEISK